MRVRLHAGAEQFLAAANPALSSDPFSTNVIAVVAERIAASTEPDSDGNLWATIERSDGCVVGLAMQTPPFHLFVSRMPAEAAATLANALADEGRGLPGVNGAVSSTTAFAKIWESRTGRSSRVITAMRMYRLAELVKPNSVAGEGQVATGDDLDLVAGWFAAFHDEAQPHAPTLDWLVFAGGRIAAGQVHLWRADRERLALAAVSAPASGVARVGPVYTQPSARRRGYGSAITATATAAALEAGAQHVTLYTDLQNPTSNSIYQAIGFRPHHDAEERVFE